MSTMRLLLFATAAVVLNAAAALAQQAGGGDAERGFEFAPRGYVQFDWRGYPDWDVVPGTGRLERETIEVRRARVGFDGRWKRATFEVTIDPQDTDGVLVKDAYAQFRFTRALRLRAGQFKLPGSREYGTSARTLDFMERSAFADVAAAGRDIGAMLTGEIGRKWEYESGVFAGDGNGRQSRAAVTAAGRVVYAAASGLDIGVSFSEGRSDDVDDTEAPSSIEGRSSSGYRFFERVYVNGRRARVGGDVEWDAGPWQLTAEFLRTADAREGQGVEFDDLPDVVGLGWSAAVRREFGRRQGGARSRLRELDLGVRYDALTFDDNGPDTGRGSVRPRASDIRGRGVHTLTMSASWRPLPWARVIGNAAVEQYPEERSAPSAGRSGAYWVIGTRFQLELP